MTVPDLALNIYKVCVCKSVTATHRTLEIDVEQIPVSGRERKIDVLVVTKNLKQFRKF